MRTATTISPSGVGLKTVWDGRYALAIPIIIWGGIYSGVFTPTEAAAAAVVVTIAVGFWQGTLELADFPKMLESSAKVNGVIVPIIAFALPLAQALAALNVPQSIVQEISQYTNDPTLIILMMLGVFILAGCVMETTPNIVILAPIMLPIAKDIGMDPIHFCIFMVTALGVGFITPPLGLNLFVLSGLTGRRHSAHRPQSHSVRADDAGRGADARLHPRAVNVGAALSVATRRIRRRIQRTM